MPILPQQMATGAPIPTPTPTPAPTQQPPQDIEKVRSQLFEFIKQQLSAPQPQAPQYQPQPLTNAQGFALARNPQAAPQMMQYQQAPAQAQYQQQMDMFNQAMAGKKEAVAAGTALVGQQTKASNRPLKFIKSAITENGVKRTKLDVFDPSSFEYVGTADLGQAPDNSVLAYDREGNAFWAEKPGSGKAPSPVVTPGGKQAGKQPNPTVVGSLLSTNKVLAELDNMEKILDKAWATQTTGQRMLGAQLTHTKEGESPGLVARVGGYINPLAAEHEAARQRLVGELGPVITSQNRALATIATRIEKSLPDIGTNPIVYKKTIADLRTLTKEIDRGQKAMYPVETSAIGRSQQQTTTPTQTDPLLDELWNQYGQK